VHQNFLEGVLQMKSKQPGMHSLFTFHYDPQTNSPCDWDQCWEGRNIDFPTGVKVHMIFLLNYLQGREYLCYHIQNYPHLRLKKS
jgi:hypothetical protein